MSSPFQHPTAETRPGAWKRRVRPYLRDTVTPPVPKAYTPPTCSPPPITKIPNELILEIIKLAVDDSDPDNPRDAFLTVASQVCSSWRGLTLSERKLWATIGINNSRAGQRDLAPQLARAETYAARASQQPIRLFLVVRPLPLRPRLRGAEEAAHAVSAFLASHVHRLCAFSLRFMPGFCREDVRRMLPQTHAPDLRTCAVYGTSMAQYSAGMPRLAETPVLPWLEPMPPSPTQELGESDMLPALERLCLEAAPMAWSRLALFSSLRSLELRDLGERARCTWAELRAVLQANAHTLTRLALFGVLPLKPPIVMAPVVLLPALTTLCIGRAAPVALAHFSTTIQVQALDTLVLHDVRYGLVPRMAGATTYTDEGLAFRKMIEHIPLHRVRQLRLSRVAFGPAGHRSISATPNVITNTNIDTTTGEGSSALFPHALFARMDSLHTLALMNPDIATIEALNSVLPPRLACVGFPDVSTAMLDAFMMPRVGEPGTMLEELWVWPYHHYTGPSMGAGVARRVVVGVLGKGW